MEPRQKLIFRVTEDYQHRTSASWPSIATAIVEAYHARVPAEHRSVAFHAGGDAYADARANAQMIRRFREGEARLPVELEEAWVLSLPAPWREELLSGLAARYGLLAVRMVDGEGEHHADLAKLFREVGEAGQMVSRMLADGRIDAQDRPLLERTLAEIDEVIVAAVELSQNIRTRVLGPQAVQPLAQPAARAH